MSDASVTLSNLKQRIAAAEKAKMLAELQVQQAREQVKVSGTFLKENFGVESVSEAKQLLVTLSSDLNDKLAEVSSLLDEFERIERERRINLPGNLSFPG